MEFHYTMTCIAINQQPFLSSALVRDDWAAKYPLWRWVGLGAMPRSASLTSCYSCPDCMSSDRQRRNGVLGRQSGRKSPGRDASMSTDTEHATYPSLRGKTVAITGGAEGIGAAAVELFARQGSKVLILDISESSAKKVIANIESISPNDGQPRISAPIFYHCDVSNIDQLQDIAKRILTDHGAVNILINNAASAGGRARKDTFSMTPADWDLNMNVNLRHIFFLTQAFVPAMREAGGGSIVNLGSITWRIPAVGLPAYTTAKAAIMGLTRTHSKEFGQWNIRVNSVMPGAIATERQIKEVLTEEYRAQVFAAQSLKRDLLPVEAANVILFLASNQASGVTGSSYVVDGGWCSDP